RGQRLVDRAALGDREQPRLLRVVERAFECDASLDPLDAALSALAFLAVLFVVARVGEPDLDALERPALLARIEADRHRGAGPEGGGQQVVGIGAGIPPPRRERLVADEAMPSRLDLLLERSRTAPDHDLAGHATSFGGRFSGSRAAG